MQTETVIPARFNGPPASGNGGYSCGVLAAHIDGPARVRLHVPPPLDTPLAIVTMPNGGVEMYDGDTLIGSGGNATLELDIPPAPSIKVAQKAMSGFPCYEDHAFPTCFVCGPGRAAHDGLEIFPGPTGDSGILASVWRPGADLLDETGKVRVEFLWAALDCPGYFAATGDELLPAVLGELVGEIYARVDGQQDLIVYAWPVGEDGRKFYGGTAIVTDSGEIVAASRSTWIQLKS